jgi:hypothetical protein
MLDSARAIDWTAAFGGVVVVVAPFVCCFIEAHCGGLVTLIAILPITEQ